MSRLDAATEAVREAIAFLARPAIALDEIGEDDDLIVDLELDPYQLESLALILEEMFCVSLIPQSLFKSPHYRTASSLAEWLIRQSTAEAWREAKADRRRA